MLSMESRMRGDMQVRFGGRYEETYCRKAARRLVPSLRLGKGGGIIELAAHLYATDHVPYLLERIAEQTPHVHPVSFSFGKQDSFGPSFQQLEIVPLSSPALLSYLQGRGINLELAKRECSEARYTHNGKRYFAIAFPTVRVGLRFVTPISRAASPPRKSPTSDSREKQGLPAMCSRVSWTTFPF